MPHLHTGFPAPEPSGSTTGDLCESVPDGKGVSGGRRAAPGGWGDGPAAPTAAVSLPLWLADLGSTATCRVLDGLTPSGPSDPVSK